MADWITEIEGVISDIQAGQVNDVDVRTLRRVQAEIERLNKELTASLERERKIAKAGEDVALRLAENLRAAKRGMELSIIAPGGDDG